MYIHYSFKMKVVLIAGILSVLFLLTVLVFSNVLILNVLVVIVMILVVCAAPLLLYKYVTRNSYLVGDSLIKPETTKHTNVYNLQYLTVVSCSMQGWRTSMEDAHVIKLPEPTSSDSMNSTYRISDKSLKFNELTPLLSSTSEGAHKEFKFSIDNTEVEDYTTQSTAVYNERPDPTVRSSEPRYLKGQYIFGVFDGHGGSFVSKYCSEHMVPSITGTLPYKQHRYKDAFIEGFMSLDQHLYEVHRLNANTQGSTANMLLLTENQLYCANLGDSRSILCKGNRAIPLSVDHKPQLQTELTRILNANHYVRNQRVDGILALSRAIGDFFFKQSKDQAWADQAVSSKPEVTSITLNKLDQFVVSACDGIWDVMTPQEVVDFVLNQLNQDIDPRSIAENLLDNCLSPEPFRLGCDNMTLILILFKDHDAV